MQIPISPVVLGLKKKYIKQSIICISFVSRLPRWPLRTWRANMKMRNPWWRRQWWSLEMNWRPSKKTQPPFPRWGQCLPQGAFIGLYRRLLLLRTSKLVSFFNIHDLTKCSVFVIFYQNVTAWNSFTFWLISPRSDISHLVTVTARDGNKWRFWFLWTILILVS